MKEEVERIISVCLQFTAHREAMSHHRYALNNNELHPKRLVISKMDYREKDSFWIMFIFIGNKTLIQIYSKHKKNTAT